MRERCKILIALGDCAVLRRHRDHAQLRAHRGRPAPGLHRDREHRGRADSRATKTWPSCRTPAPLDQVVPVDIYLPGCPPSADAIFYVLSELLAGRKPVLQGKYLDWH